MSNRIKCWNYNLPAIEESLKEKLKLCKDDPFCKNLMQDSRRKCKHFYQIYFNKWDKFLAQLEND